MPSLRKVAPDLFKYQADATLSQANPVSGTKYEVLATTKNVRIISIYANVTWAVQPTPLEIHITIDGQTLTFTKADPVSATSYFTNLSGGTTGGELSATDVCKENGRAFMLEGRSVKVQAEITGGTVSNLSARVKYAKIP